MAASLLATVAVALGLGLAGSACGSDDSPVIEAPATSEVPQRSGGY
jgi:hypothetical protein